MAIGYGSGRGYIVKLSDVNNVYTNNMTIVTSANGLDGNYVFEGTHNTGGCGGPDSGVFIQLKDTIAWSKITVRFTVTGVSACWTFMGGGNSSDGSNNGVDGTVGGNYGNAGTPPIEMSNFPGGNIQVYNETLGDRMFWDDGAFSSSAGFIRKLNACDNDVTNFFRYGATKQFWVTCRRKPASSGLAGVWAGRSCNQTGVNTKIENIIIW